jgi:hypothetical protein
VGNQVLVVKRGTGQLHPVTYEIEPVHGVAALFALADMLFVGYNDGSMRQWQQSELVKTWRPHRQAVGGIFVTAKRVYSTSADGSAAVMAREGGAISMLVEASKRPLRCIIEHANLVVVAAGMNLHVHKKDGTHKAQLKQHTADVHSFVADRDLLFSGGGDRRVVLWSLSKLEALLVIVTGHSNRVKCMALNGSLLYTGSGDKTVRVFDLKEAFVQRGEWQKEHKKSAAKVITSIFKKKPSGTDARPTNNDPKAAPVVKTLQVTNSDMQDLANWMAQSQQIAEVDKQKEEAFKAQRPGSRTGRSSASTSAAPSAAAPAMSAAAAPRAAPSGGPTPLARPPPQQQQQQQHHQQPQQQQQSYAPHLGQQAHRRATSSSPQPPFGGSVAAYPPQYPQHSAQQQGYPQPVQSPFAPAAPYGFQQQSSALPPPPPFGGDSMYRPDVAAQSTLYVESDPSPYPGEEDDIANPYANLPNMSNVQPRMAGPRF